MSTVLKFNLQGIDTDLELELKKSKEYFDWRNKGKSDWMRTEIEFSSDLDVCPVGSIEFVEKILGKSLKPNIPPPPLRHWLGRKHGEFKDVSPEEIAVSSSHTYVKSMDKLKDPENGWWSLGIKKRGNWFFTEGVNVSGEFRVFLGRYGEVLDIRNYVGFEVWPNINIVRSMAKEIFEYYKRPMSFDVMVTDDNRTLLLEIHDYFALGLYGFSDLSKTPYLILDWYKSCLD